MQRRISLNFSYLVDSFLEGKRGVILEGGSRSRKTWSALDFIIWLINVHRIENEVINIIRETYSSFKTTLMNDINKRFPDFGIQSPFEDVEEKKTFKIYSNRINLIGADKVSTFEGMGCGFAYFNEIINISNEIFDQQEMRCEKFWFGDMNPKYSESWVYDKVIPRPDVGHLITTFIHNPFAPEKQVKKILSYEPTEENIKNGTADEYKWKVYGLGLRSSPEGLIFPYWEEYNELPVIDLYQMFVVDWGGNDPTTLTELNISKDLGALFLKEIVYTPQILNSKLIETIWKVNPVNRPVVVDSSRKDKKYELSMAGIQVYGASKGAGSKINQIDMMKEYKLFVHHKSENIKKELNSYRWAVDPKTGKALNEPIDGNDHVLDPTGYGVRFYRKVINP